MRSHSYAPSEMQQMDQVNSNNIALWHACCSSDQATKMEQWCLQWLNDSEQERANEFKVATSQHQHIVGRGMARWLLQTKECGPRDIQFEIENQGKPFVAEPAVAKRPFNVSHTDGLVLCILGTLQHRHVGVDVERLDRRTNPDLATRYFSAPEIEQLNLVSEPIERKYLFLKIWTLKEAFIKAIGTGLRTPLSHFAFEKLDSPNPTIRFLETGLDQNLNWFFHCLEPRPGFIASAAVAHQSGTPKPKIFTENFEDQIQINPSH